MFRSRNQNPPTYASLFKNLKAKPSVVATTSKTAGIAIDKTSANGVTPVETQSPPRLNEPISYESFMKMRKHLVQEQSITHEDRLPYLPIKYITLHLVILTFISFILIGLQIIVINQNQQFSYIGTGVWMGVYNLLLVVLSVLSIKKQKRALIIIVENMHIIGCILTLGAVIGLNSIVIMNTACQQKQNCNSNNVASITTTTPSSSSIPGINVNIFFISIGIVCVLLYIAFFICIECTIKSNFTNGNTNTRQIYPIPAETTATI